MFLGSTTSANVSTRLGQLVHRPHTNDGGKSSLSSPEEGGFTAVDDVSLVRSEQVDAATHAHQSGRAFQRALSGTHSSQFAGVAVALSAGVVAKISTTKAMLPVLPCPSTASPYPSAGGISATTWVPTF